MSLFLHELRAEQRLFWRNREAAIFTFLLPMIFFLMFGSIYGDETIEKDRYRGRRVPRGRDDRLRRRRDRFAGLAITLVIRRESGVLKRIRATPLPPATYLARGARLDARSSS